MAEQGNDPAVMPGMLRHGSKDITMRCIPAKAREAQEHYIAQLVHAEEPGRSAVRVHCIGSNAQVL